VQVLAEQLYKEALQGRREVLGPHHPDTLTSLDNLATLYSDQGRHREAEPLYKEALNPHSSDEASVCFGFGAIQL
jgi:Tfp pilus assembly protein PilF